MVISEVKTWINALVTDASSVRNFTYLQLIVLLSYQKTYCYIIILCVWFLPYIKVAEPTVMCAVYHLLSDLIRNGCYSDDCEIEQIYKNLICKQSCPLSQRLGLCCRT